MDLYKYAFVPLAVVFLAVYITVTVMVSMLWALAVWGTHRILRSQHISSGTQCSFLGHFSGTFIWWIRLVLKDFGR